MIEVMVVMVIIGMFSNVAGNPIRARDKAFSRRDEGRPQEPLTRIS